MLIGIALILLATLAYNGSTILLAAAARSRDEQFGPALLAGVLSRLRGSAGVALTLLGWLLELIALTRLSLTVDKIVMTAGFALLLVLAAWGLKEPVGWRQILGASAIGVGIIAIALMAPGNHDVRPSPTGWLVLLALLGPGMLLPSLLRGRVLRRRARVRVGVGPMICAVGAGLGYALSGMLTKGLAEALPARRPLALGLLLLGVGLAGMLAWMNELAALQQGQATAVVPIVAALQTVVPIVLAPFFFGEIWPATTMMRLVVIGGVVCDVVGVLILARSAADVVAMTAG